MVVFFWDKIIYFYAHLSLTNFFLLNTCACGKPGSYFLRMRMRSEFDVNLTSHPPFAAIIRKGVEQSATAANCSLRICDVKIRFAFAFAFAGSMNRALHGKLEILRGIKC